MNTHHPNAQRYFILFDNSSTRVFLDQHQLDELNTLAAAGCDTGKECKILHYPMDLNASPVKGWGQKAWGTMRKKRAWRSLKPRPCLCKLLAPEQTEETEARSYRRLTIQRPDQSVPAGCSVRGFRQSSQSRLSSATARPGQSNRFGNRRLGRQAGQMHRPIVVRHPEKRCRSPGAYWGPAIESDACRSARCEEAKRL
jgi:hypothetical protein